VKMRLTCLVAAILGDILLFAVRPVIGADAIWVQPSGNWYVVVVEFPFFFNAGLASLSSSSSNGQTPYCLCRFGIDGDWSSFAFGVGAPMQHVELTVSTALSEIWVIENTGCSPSE
jgi:hypothetical protein